MRQHERPSDHAEKNRYRSDQSPEQVVDHLAPPDDQLPFGSASNALTVVGNKLLPVNIPIEHVHLKLLVTAAGAE